MYVCGLPIMTPEEVTAIRAKWAKNVRAEDQFPDDPIAHENELRRTIRELCDEVELQWRIVEEVEAGECI